MLTNEQKKERLVELLESADFSKCDLNQLVTIINLYDLLKVPMKASPYNEN